MSVIPSGVQPVPATPSAGREILVPFQIDPATGGVAYLDGELAIYDQHLATLINTQIGERLMLPGFGTNVPSRVFSPNDSSLNSLLVDDIQKQVANWLPEVTIAHIEIVPNPNTPSAVTVSVTYTVAPFNDQNVLQMNVGGGITEVTSP